MFRAAISKTARPAVAGVAERCADILGDADISRIAASADLAGELARLRDRGLTLAGVSNTTTRGELLDAVLEAIGVRTQLAAVVYSSVHGFKKPHRTIYESVLASLGIEAGQALFVGDRVREDVLGPQSVGMRAVLTHEHRQEPAEGAEPLAIIHCLSDLEAVLSAL
jgi:putative hydrolase of the HAD superfamily